MLDALRSRASSWVVKVFLGLLILSFAIWGIGDIFLGPRGGNVVAEVADLEVTVPEVAREFEAELRRFSQQLGTPIDRGHPLAAAALNSAVQRLVTLRLLDAYALDLGVGASDEEVAARIHGNPDFRSSTGFEPQRLEFFLRSIGMSERDYVEELRRQIARERIITTLREAPAGSRFLAGLLYEHRNERRVLELLLVDAAKITVEPPDDATLEAYLAENAERFRRPEYRKLVLAVLDAADLAAEISVDEQELRDLYEARREQFRIPERRHVVQLLAPDEETAKEVRTRLAAGEAPEDVAAAMAERGVRLADLGTVERSALPSAIAEAAFALEANGISEPVRSVFGWHVLLVREVLPETVASFEEKRAELEAELKRDKAVRQLPDLATALDDELAAGVPLEDAAEKLGARLYTIEAVDRQGRNPDGERVLPEVLTSDMLETIFTAPEGEPSLLEETSDGRYYVFRVDAIESERPLTLAEARDQVVAAWTRARQLEAAKTLAAKLLEQAREGGSLEQLAGTGGAVRFERTEPLRRSDDPGRYGLPAEILQAVFELPEGGILDRVAELSAGAAVVRVASVEPAPEPDEAALAAIERELRDAWETDLLTQFDGALRQRYTVEINQTALAALLQG